MNSSLRIKLIVAILVIATAIVIYIKLGDTLTLDYLASQETQLRNYQQENPRLIYALAFLLYVLITGMSIPGATALSLLYAWFFGLARGVVLVSLASTTGATFAFLLSRYFFREAFQEKFGARLQQFNESLEREGPFYLFTLRLLPMVPFFVINAVMGLTPIKTFTYWWVSLLGMLPGTIIYVYAGASVPTLTELAEQGTRGILSPQILAALAALGLFPFAARFLLTKFTSARIPPSSTDV